MPLLKKKLLLKISIPLLIGGFFIALTYYQTTDEQRRQIIKYISQTSGWIIGISLIFGFLSNLSRAIRWNYLLEPLGYKPKLANNILAILVAFLSNLGIPRSGEILRASTITSYEKIPFSKALGTIAIERVVDLIMLLIIVIIAMLYNFEYIMQLLMEAVKNGNKIAVVLLLIVGVGFLTFILLRRVPKKRLSVVRKFGAEFLDGLKSIRRLRKKIPFILHSVFIWLMYVLMFYIIKFALDETYMIGFDIILPAFIIGALVIATTNGGVGIFPLAVGTYLTTFGISEESGLAFGWIVWTIQTVMIIVFGSIAFVLLPIVNRKK